MDGTDVETALERRQQGGLVKRGGGEGRQVGGGARERGRERDRGIEGGRERERDGRVRGLKQHWEVWVVKTMKLGPQTVE